MANSSKLFTWNMLIVVQHKSFISALWLINELVFIILFAYESIAWFHAKAFMII